MDGSGKRGRPAKAPPAVDQQVLKEVRSMAKRYTDAKLYTIYIENRRSSLLERAGVDLEKSERLGIVVYDAEEVANFPVKDRNTVNCYLRCKSTVLCIEKGIKAIPDERTREMAVHTILKGKRCEDLTSFFRISRMTAFREKGRAIQWISYFWRCKNK